MCIEEDREAEKSTWKKFNNDCALLKNVFIYSDVEFHVDASIDFLCRCNLALALAQIFRFSATFVTCFVVLFCTGVVNILR